MPYINFTPTQNVYVSLKDYQKNFYNSTSLFIGTNNDNSDRFISLLKFNIDRLPINTTIISAKLKLYIYINENLYVDKWSKLYKCVNDFLEDSVTYYSRPLVAITPITTIKITNEIYRYIEYDITNLVDGWHKGNVPNNGIMIEGQNNIYSFTGFWNTRYEDSRYWPFLEINYSQGAIRQYPVQNFTTTDNFTGSTPIFIGSNSATFGVKNVGTLNSAIVILQLSPDGVNWIDNTVSFATMMVINPEQSLILTTDGNMSYARVCFKSTTDGKSTQLDIYPAIKE